MTVVTISATLLAVILVALGVTLALSLARAGRGDERDPDRPIPPGMG